MSLIKGIHHYSLKCRGGEEFERVMSFYHGLLQMPVSQEWESGVLLDTGSGLVEVFHTGEGDHCDGVIRHIALDTDQVDACIETVRAAGYEILTEPKDIDSPFAARIAFCRGPLGEQIEFFHFY